MPNRIFTIGHSNWPFDKFVDLLRGQGIELICDVRTSPISRLSHFSGAELKSALAALNIRYVYAGKSLGARSRDPEDYLRGQVQFEKLAAKPLFKKAITRLREDANRFRIALMCAEREPLECHRTILVSRNLQDENTKVSHILGNGALESHDDAMLRLVDMLGLPTLQLMTDKEGLFREAYSLQSERIAYQDVSARQESSQNLWDLAI